MTGRWAYLTKYPVPCSAWSKLLKGSSPTTQPSPSTLTVHDSFAPAGPRRSSGTSSKSTSCGNGNFPALTEAAGFRRDGRVILIRQETNDQREGPFAHVNALSHPRVCRAYELPEQGEPKKIAEIAEFDWYVEHIAVTPDAAYFAIQGSSIKSGKPKRLIHLYDGSTWAQLGAIPTNIAANDTATGMRFDPKGLRLHVTVDSAGHEVFEVPSLKPAGAMKHTAACVNVGASRWVFMQSPTADTPEMLVLNERGRDVPLLRIVRDVSVSGSDGIKFSPDGNHIVWGNQDGTVTVCDLNEVQRRLAGESDFRLGVRAERSIACPISPPATDSLVEGRPPKSSTE